MWTCKFLYQFDKMSLTLLAIFWNSSLWGEKKDEGSDIATLENDLDVSKKLTILSEPYKETLFDSRHLLPHFLMAKFLTAKELCVRMLFAISFLVKKNFSNSNAHQ